MENLKEVLNRPNSTNRAVFSDERQENAEHRYWPLQIIRTRRCHKEAREKRSRRVREIASEMPLNLHEDAKLALLDIMNEILEFEQVSEEWKHGLIIKLPKKGDLSDCVIIGEVLFYCQ